MTQFRFQTEDLSDLMTDNCRAGVRTPPGSFAREVRERGHVGALEKLTTNELSDIGVAVVVMGTYDATVETLDTSDWARNQDGSVILVDQTATEVLVTSPINPVVIAENEATLVVMVQETALHTVDQQAEAARLTYITPGDGQAMSYREKSDQAKDCLANHSAEIPPDTGIYVLLDSEVGILANADDTITADAYEVAVVVENTRLEWLIVEAGINHTRMQAKADVRVATTTAEIEAILAALSWI